MESKIKSIIGAVVALGVVSIPGFSEAITAAGGEQAILAAFAAIWAVAHGLIDYFHGRASGGTPPGALLLAFMLAAGTGHAQEVSGLSRPVPASGIEALEGVRQAGGDAPTPNESYLAKQMQGVIAACMGGLIFELSDGAQSVTSPWDRVNEVVHTPDDWRASNMEYRYRGTVAGSAYSGAYVKFRNARYDPEHSDIRYGDKRVAQDVNVNNNAKTKLIKNDSDAPVTVHYEESESLTDSFSTSVTHGLTMDLSVDSTQTISGGYAGVSAEVSMQEHFGVSRTQEETRESAEEGSHTESISIEFDAAAGEYYLVTISKEHAVTYQPFTIDGVMDFDIEIGFGSVGGGRQRGRLPAATVHLSGGVAGFDQFVHGYDTAYPAMRGFYAAAYTRTKAGIDCVLDADRRRIQVSGTNQSSLESNADYAVQSLGHTVPPHLAHLPVEDASDVGGGQ